MKNTEYLEAGSRGVCGYFEAKQEGTFNFLISSYSSISLSFGVWFYAQSGFVHSLQRPVQLFTMSSAGANLSCFDLIDRA